MDALSTAERIDLIGGTPRLKAAAQALAGQVHLTPGEAVAIAAAVLRDAGVDPQYNPAGGLTVEQEIRARALDGAARLLGPALGVAIPIEHRGDRTKAVIYEWERLARAAEEWIMDGSFASDMAARIPTPPPPLVIL